MSFEQRYHVQDLDDLQTIFKALNNKSQPRFSFRIALDITHFTQQDRLEALDQVIKHFQAHPDWITGFDLILLTIVVNRNAGEAVVNRLAVLFGERLYAPGLEICLADSFLSDSQLDRIFNAMLRIKQHKFALRLERNQLESTAKLADLLNKGYIAEGSTISFRRNRVKHVNNLFKSLASDKCPQNLLLDMSFNKIEDHSLNLLLQSLATKTNSKLNINIYKNNYSTVGIANAIRTIIDHKLYMRCNFMDLFAGIESLLETEQPSNRPSRRNLRINLSRVVLSERKFLFYSNVLINHVNIEGCILFFGATNGFVSTYRVVKLLDIIVKLKHLDSMSLNLSGVKFINNSLSDIALALKKRPAYKRLSIILDKNISSSDFLSLPIASNIPDFYLKALLGKNDLDSVKQLLESDNIPANLYLDLSNSYLTGSAIKVIFQSMLQSNQTSAITLNLSHVYLTKSDCEIISSTIKDKDIPTKLTLIMMNNIFEEGCVDILCKALTSGRCSSGLKFNLGGKIKVENKDVICDYIEDYKQAIYLDEKFDTFHKIVLADKERLGTNLVKHGTIMRDGDQKESSFSSIPPELRFMILGAAGISVSQETRFKQMHNNLQKTYNELKLLSKCNCPKSMSDLLSAIELAIQGNNILLNGIPQNALLRFFAEENMSEPSMATAILYRRFLDNGYVMPSIENALKFQLTLKFHNHYSTEYGDEPKGNYSVNI